VERQTPGVRAIFDQAREIDSPDERAAFLNRACAHTPDVRAEVEALLRAGAAAGSFLETPAAGRLAGALPGGSGGDDTRTGPAALVDEPLDFLEPSDKPGSIGRLGHYEVREVVGCGGMGVVLKAFDETLHRGVAIKVMAPHLASSATARRRFAREARATAAVTHDHIVTIHAVEESGPLPYIVMQFVAGQSLQDRLDRTGPLQLPEILRIGMQTASGLAAAHAQGLVHRDVKPANILLENGVERVKITDFGLARAADDASLTQSGTVAGTPAFMSPEQAEGKPVDHRSDLFSLGSVLYALCTGRPPFRADTSMAVLKRVCEDAPTPIRAANSEVPDWLVDAITKLHAKDPSARFQSAAEVAEVLGRRLAQVQHPSVVPIPAVINPADESPTPIRRLRSRHRWATAAGVLAATLAVLGTTEATGVTNVRATAIRILTPEGKLVVETDDPDVKVTVEGDGDLVITGAGPREVRLKAGSYRLTATRDGKPVKLDRDLVTITRGDRQIVRIRLEGDASAAVAPAAERGAFVVLGGKGVEVAKFDSLAEAVQAASDGDTVEVRGNGPFLTEPINLGRTALTIRAGAGHRPVIKSRPAGNQKFRALLETEAILLLEGLELQRVTPDAPWDGVWRGIVSSSNAPLHAANCRFVARNFHYGISATSPTCQLWNCEILCEHTGVGWAPVQGGSRLLIDNCLQATGLIALGSQAPDDKEPASVRLTRVTSLAGYVFLRFDFGPERWQRLLKADRGTRIMRVEASGSIFDTERVLADVALDRDVPDGEVETFLATGVAWQGQQNLYAVRGPYVSLTAPGGKVLGPGGTVKSFADWAKFWGAAEAGSTTGRVRYQGGDLIAKLRDTPERVAPDDFRLRPDSAGYRAGKDGKDLGADIDLVGPGPAYERWKKTQEYQQWLREIGQVKK
jgi:serine/threonine protein kinase